jgi:hypothetical protein
MSTEFSSALSQNLEMPAPVPPPSTIGVSNPEFSPKYSAAIVENGSTVEDPVMWILFSAYAKVGIARIVARTASVSFIRFP